MRPLSTIELLAVWEAGVNQTLIEKSLHLLSVACSTPDINGLAHLSIGERDTRLIQLREWMFGSRLVNLSNCPACSDLVEWTMDIADIGLQDPQINISPKVFALHQDEFIVDFRLPNSSDLAKVISNTVYASNPKKLLLECILEVRRNQDVYPAEHLPDHILEILDQRISEEDPQANISMLLSCPVCSHQWKALFDITSYLWTEINGWARHMLQEVYVLASAFGWSEYDILNLSPGRRRLYLEMVRS